MRPITIHEAATTTGWSPRMLRYIEQLGLVDAPRSSGGYRLYGPGQVVRLRALRRLLDAHALELGDVALVARLRREPDLRSALDEWFSTTPAVMPPPPPAPSQEALADWLAFEQDKHSQLLTSGRQDTA